MFHLGWFLGDSTGIHKWWGAWSSSNGKDWMKPDIYIDLATSLERGGFDLMFIEDTAMVEDTLGGWDQVARTHFAEGGILDKVMAQH